MSTALPVLECICEFLARGRIRKGRNGLTLAWVHPPGLEVVVGGAVVGLVPPVVGVEEPLSLPLMNVRAACPYLLPYC